jgi:hypothetical protein
MATEPKPLVQVDDVVREMTEEEYEAWQAMQAEITPLGHE